MLNQLIEIPRKDLHKLRVLYLKNWPENFLGFYTLNNFCQWFNIEPKLKNIYIYSLNGDWSDGTFLILDRYMLFLNSLNESNNRLEEALRLIDWSKRYEITSILEKHHSMILNIIKSKNLLINCNDLNLLYYLPKEEAGNIQINERNDVILKHLTDKDAEICNKYWPYKHEGSLYFLKLLTKLNLCIGAYTKQNELITWCLQTQGPLSNLYTKDEYKGKGLASYLVGNMIKILAENNHDTYSFISETNKPSRRIFDKFNFRIIGKTYWVQVNWSKIDEFCDNFNSKI